MFADIKYIVSYLHGFVFHTRQTWQRLKASPKEQLEVEYFRTHFYWPLLGVGALLIFIMYGNGYFATSNLAFDDPFSFEYAMKGVVKFAVPYALAPMLATLLVRDLGGKRLGIVFKETNLELFVTACVAIDMVIVVFCAFLPGFQFVRFLRLFVISVVVSGSREIVDVANEERTLFIIDVYFSIFASVWVLEYLTGMMQRI